MPFHPRLAPRRGRTRRRITESVGAVAATALVAVAFSTAASGKTAHAAARAHAATSSAYEAAVKKLVAGGESGFLYDPQPDLAGTLNPSAMVVLKVGQWRGPTSAPKAKKGEKIEVISCAAGSACDGAADGVIAASKALGWPVHYSASDGTPSGDVRAFDAAVARHPNAIIGVALSQAVLGQPMAAAHKLGIKVVGIALPQTEKPPNGYDVTAPAPEAAATQVQLWAAMADSGFKAKVGYMWDTASGTLGQVLPIVEKQTTMCSGCSNVPDVNHAYAACANPVTMAGLTTSLIESNPTMSYILTPYGCGVPGILNGIKQSVNPKVKVLSQNGEVQQVAEVHQGQMFADVGFSLTQMGFTGVDALVRLFAGQRALPVNKEGVVLHIFAKSNAPASGNFNWVKAFPFEQEYEKAWGVK